MINFLPLLIIIITTGLTLFITKNWLSPGSFFSLCWSFFLIVPFIFAPEFNLNIYGLWYIAIFTMAFASGSIIGYSFSSNDISSSKLVNSYFNYKTLIYSLIIFSTISALGIHLLLQFASSIYGSANYSISLINLPNLIAIDRYSGYLDYPFIIKYSLYFIYPGNLLGGLLLSRKKNSKIIKFILFVPMLEALLLGIIEGARTSILLGLILFFSAWLSGFMIRKKESNFRLSIFKTSFILGSVIISFSGIFIIIQWLRQGMDSLIVDILVDRIRAYFFGYLSAFTQWFGEEGSTTFNGGSTTFAGPFNLLGIIDRPLGFYNPISISNQISTNIFTALRGLIIDFSIPGSILIAFTLGFIIQIYYQINLEVSLLRTLPISMFYAFTLYSPLISIFHYNSILFSWLVILIPLSLKK